MSGGQAAFSLDAEPAATGIAEVAARRARRGQTVIPVIRANEEELAAHQRALESVERAANAPALFRDH